VDPDQRYYLESRGVHPSDAQRLIVQGFFEDIVVRSPILSTVPFLRSEVAGRLPAVVGGAKTDA
jgi:Fe-S cluster assembly scaffold protein SufB